MANEKDKVESSIIKNDRKYAYTGKRNIILIPQPSNDIMDPLNWSMRKKYSTLFIVCFSAFAGACTPTSHQLAYVEMAPTYQKAPIQLEYSISAAVAGLLAGPVFFIPLARLVGRSSLIFWSLLGALCCQIWAAEMTQKDDYIPFVVSRLMGGMFGAVPTVIGSGYIIDIFFLHQRGVAFTCYELSLLLGVFIGPTLGGFIIESRPWPFVFWWTIAPLGTSAILTFCFLQETGFARGDDLVVWPQLPSRFLPNRVTHFLVGQGTVPRSSSIEFGKRAIAPFVIGLCPAVLVAGFYTFIVFGFNIMLTTLLTIYLQTPISEGGYSFTPFQNAAFTFTSWMGLFMAQLVGTLLSDKLPLYVSRRFGHGIWHPEYRLWNMFLPALVMPIGLGIFGAGLQYHLHYMVLALAVFLVNFAALLTVPVCVNYAVECFTRYAVETSIIMNCYRLAFGIALPFFALPWGAKVGNGWLFGMAAFFSLFAASLIGLLAWKGPLLRGYILMSGLASTEEGEAVLEERTSQNCT